MALLVPNIGEIESLRYLIAQNNFVADLEDTSPRNLVLKLFTSNTTPAEGDVPSQTAYFGLILMVTSMVTELPQILVIPNVWITESIRIIPNSTVFF